MRTLIFLSAILLLVCGCKSKVQVEQTEETNRIVKVWGDFADSLAKIKDKQTMDEEKPNLMKLADEYKALVEADAQKYPVGATRPKTPEEQQKKLKEAVAKYGSESKRVRELPGGAALLAEFDLRRIPQPAKQ